jgi:UDP-glucuronate decarboxylase
VRRKPDISLARGKLGWEIKVQLLDGLRETIEYFKKILPA